MWKFKQHNETQQEKIFHQIFQMCSLSSKTKNKNKLNAWFNKKTVTETATKIQAKTRTSNNQYMETKIKIAVKINATK